MKLTINGETRESDSKTLGELVGELELSPHQIAIEVNEVLVPREKHGGFELNQDDQIEIVSLVGGG